jgi:ABC-type glycerol-3-phosphate transport system substrate-binding protein
MRLHFTKFQAGPALAGIACLLPVLLGGCRQAPPEQKNRVVVEYWDKWTGFEAEAMRAVVADFNASQDRIFVKFTPVSQIDRKMMLATAGGVPPDVAGLYAWVLPVYAENNALMPLDEMACEAGIRGGDYIDVFWEMCHYRGQLWSLPTTPGSVGLIWNKKMFRDAGLDPERPPASIAELEQFNEKLTRRRPGGSLETVGHLPEEPGWWDAMWGCWFGGDFWDGHGKITADSPENIAAYEWVESYPKRFGPQNLLSFREGLGNFASPQNPFFTGRVAMVLQGEWIFSYIRQYAPPGFEWGVAAFPSSDPERFKNVSIVECDVLAIPAGAKHPREAFEFIRYVNSRKPMEKLCLGQLKFSPFRECSPEFLRDHPNPQIAKFIELSKSPGAKYAPALAIWNGYRNDMKNAVSRIWAGKADAKQSLYDVQQREQQEFDRREMRHESR